MNNGKKLTPKTVDLHLHSTASDGSLAPDALVRAAVDAGLCAMALTDHDTVEGISLAQKAAKQAGILLIPGIELSASLDIPSFAEDREIHLLGYYIRPQDSALQQVLEQRQQERSQRNSKLIHRLQELGFELTLEEVALYASDGNITKAHFAMAMMKRGYVSDIHEAFSRYLAEGKPAYIPREKLPARKAIDYIRGAGGIAVLAHPFQYCEKLQEVRQMVSELIPFGLMGMECYYGAYDETQRKLLLEIVQEFGLVATGGSDFHGDFRPEQAIGGACVPYEVILHLECIKNN